MSFVVLLVTFFLIVMYVVVPVGCLLWVAVLGVVGLVRVSLGVGTLV